MKTILIGLLIVFTQLTLKAQSFTPLTDSSYSEMMMLAAGKYKIADTTFQSYRTSPIYVVVSVTDATTGEQKIICTTYNGLEGAIKFDNKKEEIDYQNGYYKFYSKRSLENVGFFSYDRQMKDSCLKTVTVEQLKKDWKTDVFKFWKKYSGECQKYYAHLLFDNGILSSQGSLNSEFSIVDKEEEK